MTTPYITINQYQRQSKAISFTLPYGSEQFDSVLFRAIPRNLACMCGTEKRPIEVSEYRVDGYSRFVADGLNAVLTLEPEDTAVPVDHFAFAVELTRLDGRVDTVLVGDFVLQANPAYLVNVATCSCGAGALQVPTAVAEVVVAPGSGTAFTLSALNSKPGDAVASITNVRWTVFREGAVITSFSGTPSLAASGPFVVGGTYARPELDLNGEPNGAYDVALIVTAGHTAYRARDTIVLTINTGTLPISAPAVTPLGENRARLDGTASVAGSLASGITNYAWTIKDSGDSTISSFGGGPGQTAVGTYVTGGTCERPSVNLPAAGVYSVCLTVTDNNANDSAEVCRTLTLASAAPVASFAISSPSAGETTFTVDAAGSTPGGSGTQISNYAWEIKAPNGAAIGSFSGAGGFDATASPLVVAGTYNNPTVQISPATNGYGNYQACLVVTDDRGASSTAVCQTAAISASPTPTAVVQQETASDPGVYAIAFDGTESQPGAGASSLTTYAWVLKDGTGATISSFSGGPVTAAAGTYVTGGTYGAPIITFPSAGAYSICLTVTNNLSAVSAQVCLAVTVLPSTGAVTLTAKGGQTLSATIRVSSGAVLPQWDFGDGATAVGQTVVHALGSSPTYTVTVTVQPADVLEINFLEVELVDDIADYTWLSDMTAIQIINFRKTEGLTGTVPSGWAPALANLVELRLNANDLTGFPANLLDLATGVQKIHVHGNQLTQAAIDNLINSLHTASTSPPSGASLMVHQQTGGGGPSAAVCSKLTTLASRGWSITYDNSPC